MLKKEFVEAEEQAQRDGIYAAWIAGLQKKEAMVRELENVTYARMKNG